MLDRSTRDFKMHVAILITFVLTIAGGEAVPCANPFQCFVSPCSVAVLPCAEFYKGATCTDDYCGGCNAIWKDVNGEVIECDPCAFPNCKNKVNCLVDPCQYAAKPKCQARKAKCISNYCGGCNAVWVNKKGKKLSQKCDCVDCYGQWDVKIRKKTCKDCTCEDIRNMGKKFAKKVCKKYQDVRKNCCQLCGTK